MGEQELRRNLIEKGWDEKEIDETMNMLYGSSQKKEFGQEKSKIMVYLTALIITVIGNIILSLFISPLLIIIKNVWIYFIIVVLGLTFGAMYTFIINDIEDLEKKHFFIAEIIIPTLALITVFIISNMANSISLRFEIPITQNPGIIAASYFLAFVTPMMVQKFVKYYSKNRKAKAAAQ